MIGTATICSLAPPGPAESSPLLIDLDWNLAERRAPGVPAEGSHLGRVLGRDALGSAAMPPRAVRGIEEDLACILETSDTTGKPSGLSILI